MSIEKINCDGNDPIDQEPGLLRRWQRTQMWVSIIGNLLRYPAANFMGEENHPKWVKEARFAYSHITEAGERFIFETGFPGKDPIEEQGSIDQQIGLEEHLVLFDFFHSDIREKLPLVIPVEPVSDNIEMMRRLGAKYLLPKHQAWYNIPSSWIDRNGSVLEEMRKYIPGTPEFMDENDFEGMITSAKKEIEEQDAEEDTEVNPQDLSEETSLFLFFDPSDIGITMSPRLSSLETDRVLSYLQETVTEEDVKRVLGETKQKIDGLNEKRKTLKQEALERCIYRIKLRIQNMYNILSPHTRIPSIIKLPPSGYELVYNRDGGFSRINQQPGLTELPNVYFLPHEGSILNVPLSSQGKPDFDKAEETDPTMWYIYRDLIADKLIGGLPLAYQFDIQNGLLDGVSRIQRNSISDYFKLAAKFSRDYNLKERWAR